MLSWLRYSHGSLQKAVDRASGGQASKECASGWLSGHAPLLAALAAQVLHNNQQAVMVAVQAWVGCGR